MFPNRKFALACLASGILLLSQGCVAKTVYDRDISMLIDALQKEKAANRASAEELRLAEMKLREQKDILKDLTNRYSLLQAERSRSVSKLGGLQKDLDALFKNTAELELVIMKNREGSKAAADSMLLKIKDMQEIVKTLLLKEEKLEH